MKAFFVLVTMINLAACSDFQGESSAVRSNVPVGLPGIADADNSIGFDEVNWIQTQKSVHLSPGLITRGVKSAKIEINYVKAQKFEVTFSILNNHGGQIASWTLPVANAYADFCNVTHYDAFDSNTQLTINVTDYSASTCASVSRNNSTSEIIFGVDRSTFAGRGLVAHVPGF